MSFPIHQTQFVHASNLFQDCPSAQEEFIQVADFAWGTNAHALVTPSDFIECLQSIADEEDDELDEEIEQVIRRAKEVPVDILIDLEN